MSNQYTPQQIAQFISEYVLNEDVKTELKKFGYNIVPNSLSKLIENLEKAGYKVLKNEEYLSLTSNPVNTSVVQINEPLEYQILGGATDNTKEDTKKELVDPFSDKPLSSTGPFTEEVLNQTKETKKNEETPPKVEEFTHTSPQKEEPVDPLQNMWFKVREKVKEVHSISLYSLIVNAQPVRLNENILTVGFSNKHTYQMNQFKREDNLSKFQDVVKDVTGQNYILVCEVLSDKKEQTPTPKKQSTELQILGGTKIEGGL